MDNEKYQKNHVSKKKRMFYMNLKIGGSFFGENKQNLHLTSDPDNSSCHDNILTQALKTKSATIRRIRKISVLSPHSHTKPIDYQLYMYYSIYYEKDK